MRRLLTLLFLALALSGVAQAQQMSDEQVVQYVKNAQQMGKNQKQITAELMRRGVTKEQVKRIREKYESSKSENAEGRTSDANKNRSRQRKEQQKKETKGLRSISKVTYPVKQQDGMVMEEDSLLWEDRASFRMEEDPTQQIYGHNIFTNERLTFEPNVNVATPENYCLGPGDEVIIDVWGASEPTIRQTI